MSIPKFLEKFLAPTFLKINKRFRFVFSVLIIAAILLTASFFYFESALIFLPILILATYFLTYFSILEGIEKKEWLMLFIMPVMLTIAFYLFFFLFFPIRWITRIPFLLLYSFSFYAILLTSNIFNVGVERSLQLYRAAFAINYFFHTVVLFGLLSVVFLLKQVFYVNALATFFCVFPLSLQLLWSVKPKTTVDKKVIEYSLFISVIIAEVAMVLSFIPLEGSIMALFLTACYYSVSGLFYHYLDEKLFKSSIKEFLFVIIVVSVILVLSIQW